MFVSSNFILYPFSNYSEHTTLVSDTPHILQGQVEAGRSTLSLRNFRKAVCMQWGWPNISVPSIFDSWLEEPVSSKCYYCIGFFLY